MPHCAGLNAWKRGETGGPCRVMPSRGRVNGYTMRRDRWALCLLTARSHDTELPSVALDVGSPRRRRFRGRLGMDFRQHPGDLEAGRIKTAGCQPLPDLFELSGIGGKLDQEGGLGFLMAVRVAVDQTLIDSSSIRRRGCSKTKTLVPNRCQGRACSRTNRLAFSTFFRGCN